MKQNNSYDLDFRKLLVLLLPTPLRKAVFVHMMYVMLAPIASLYTIFREKRKTDNIYAMYDSSYGNIARMLNRLFPSEDGKIIVRPSDMSDIQYTRSYVTDDRTDHSSYVGECYVDAQIPQPLFEVCLPDDIKEESDHIKEIVGRYALPGYEFKII